MTELRFRYASSLEKWEFSPPHPAGRIVHVHGFQSRLDARSPAQGRVAVDERGLPPRELGWKTRAAGRRTLKMLRDVTHPFPATCVRAPCHNLGTRPTA